MKSADEKIKILANRAYQLIQRSKMKNINQTTLEAAIHQQPENYSFNIYRFAAQFAAE